MLEFIKNFDFIQSLVRPLVKIHHVYKKEVGRKQRKKATRFFKIVNNIFNFDVWAEKKNAM